MSRYYCPQCGAEASLLLNLVNCLTPTCRNYDSAWAREWEASNTRHFQHSTSMGINHRFLGCHTSASGSLFDLYCYQIPGSYHICLARCGDDDADCYYIDENEQEIGNIEAGPLTTASSDVLAALKEVLRRFRKKSI